MDILKEIEYFLSCQQNTGALLLSGKWGCGKTYFIDHDLKDALSKDYEIARVSLFGINSVQELHRAVKSAFFSIKSNNNTPDSRTAHKLKTIRHKIADIANELPRVGKAINAVLTIDWIEFVTVETKVNEKTFVIVFDDLERNTLQLQELLGCINEYVETIGIKTILVANEDKFSSSDYAEIKEKVISRTLVLKPDYRKIVLTIYAKYNGTTLYSMQTVTLDGGRYRTAIPTKVSIPIDKYHRKYLSFRYFEFDTIDYLLHKYLLDEDRDEALSAYRRFLEVILIFNSSEERTNFVDYVMQDLDSVVYKIKVQAVENAVRIRGEDEPAQSVLAEALATGIVLKEMLAAYRENCIGTSTDGAP
ncbi:MAG: KAP family NTPase [Oscillospiraceae bacterium]|jgi:hypothetical protein|nr:KAP family NTPase [Oscillospiraceae bacterium]